MNLFKLKPITELNLATLVRPSSPNTYFVCPEGFSTSQPDQVAPVFSGSVDSLLAAWLDATNRQPRTIEFLFKSPPSSINNRQVTHVQRSALLGYPDVITAEIIEIPDGGATLAVYSRSQYGHSDLGANRKRITAWLALLADMRD